MYSGEFLADATDAVVTGGASEFLKQGLLGALCVLLMAAIFWVARVMLQAKDDRVNDAKDYARSLREVNDAMMALVVETNRANDALRVSLDQVQQGQMATRGAVDRLREEQTRLNLVVGARSGG
jgi:hypothetical protein